MITDDTEMAAFCERRNTACIGYQPAETEKAGRDGEARTGFFPHVRMVWESFEDRDPEELEQFCRRFYGEPVTIARTKRLVIRESIPEDFDALCWMENIGERDIFCAYIENVYPFYGYGYWTVELAEPNRQGTVIGRCGLREYEPLENDGFVLLRKEAGRGSGQTSPGSSQSGPFRLELGYAIAEGWRRQGYAYEMCRAVLACAFSKLGADEVLVRIHPRNLPSLQLARKLGFHP